MKGSERVYNKDKYLQLLTASATLYRKYSQKKNIYDMYEFLDYKCKTHGHYM